ncbi:MAG: peptidylprolyl isomerase, partial [Myxococcota bacterium]
ARHILVQYVGVRGQKPSVERTRAEAADRAEKVAGEAKKTKDVRPESERVKAFTALVDKYSDEPNAPQTRGDLGRFRDNAYEAKLVAGVKRLPVGDVSDPVESPFGFHVIWRTL